MKLFFIALAFSLVLAGLACAQDSLSSSPVLLAADETGSGPGGPPPGFSGGQGGRGPGGPGGGGQGRQQNHEALAAACSGKSAGDDCSFTGPQGDSISGQCAQARQGDDLVCRPRR